MEENSPFRSLSRRQEKNLLRAVDAAARSEFQSPERIGCPEARTLKLMAHRDSTFEPSADLIDHIATCSPCFIEYSRIRTAHQIRVRASYVVLSVAVITVLLVIGRSLDTPFGRPAVSQNETARSPEPLKELVVDLRTWGTFRSDAPEIQRRRDPLRFPRARLSLSIYLPIGSEEGAYDVALVDSSERSLRGAAGEARLRNFVQVLSVELNLSDVSPGLYELRIRRVHLPWNTYPVLLE